MKLDLEDFDQHELNIELFWAACELDVNQFISTLLHGGCISKSLAHSVIGDIIRANSFSMAKLLIMHIDYISNDTIMYINDCASDEMKTFIWERRADVKTNEQ